VSLGEEVLQTADGIITKNLVSPRHRHFAWVIYVTKATPACTMYVKVDDIDEPIETAKGIYTTTACGWVE